MSSQSGSRRSSSEIEDEKDNQGSMQYNGAGKRARTSARKPPQPLPPSRQPRNDQSDEEDMESDGDSVVDPEAFQPGAIVRVKLQNFVTYEQAEFFPGPNLNMVIGPNGTGKSSLVCAICLGLGWPPKILGRAGNYSEFVKHGTNTAEVEIELFRRPDETRNHVVRAKFFKDGEKRDFWLDGKKTSFEAVRKLTDNFNIQVDNLCQFLPQDKVANFLSYLLFDLLLQTQRAAAPQEMLFQHKELKTKRREQMGLEQVTDADREQLEGLQSRQDSLRVEVDKLQERNKILEDVDRARKSIPFVDYRIARDAHIAFKNEKVESQKRFRRLEARIEPSLQSTRDKQAYQDRIAVAVKALETAVTHAEREADDVFRSIDQVDGTITRDNGLIKVEQDGNKKKKQEIQGVQRTILNLKARQKETPVEFDPAEWNEKIRSKERELRNVDTEISELKAQEGELGHQAREVRDHKEEAKMELGALDTQEGKQMNKLEQFNREAAKAWKWVQEHQDEFEKEIYGPPLITCSIKDPRYTPAIEAMMTQQDYVAFTAQTSADMKKLSDQLNGIMGFASFPIRQNDGWELHHPAQKPISGGDMERFGMDGYALEYIDGPALVLSMLCAARNVDKAPISLRDFNDEQWNGVSQNVHVGVIAAGKTIYNIRRRAEYGPLAVSTSTKSIPPAKHWVDQPVDVSVRAEIQSRIDSNHAKWEALKEQVMPIRAKIKELGSTKPDLQKEIAKLRKDKNALQTEFGAWAGLPEKITREEEDLEGKRKEMHEGFARVRNIQVNLDRSVLKKAKLAFEYKNFISQIRQRHQELLEAQIHYIEAKSDVEALEAKNETIKTRLETERQKVIDLEQEAKRVKDNARLALQTCQEIQSNHSAEEQQYYTSLPEDLTVERLEVEITAAEARLEFTVASNPNALRDFDRREIDINRLKEKIADNEEKLARLGQSINEIRSLWEPALDALIAEISEAFAFNFEQIGCAGQVSIHKDDDFNEWAIEIKVKFRENETLQILDSHRQSGGERSVSTIFYLMALQSLAKAPFRVVDEINQGMDARNEKMVHERMVEIACKEHTSQYFLITPKLLTGLRYHKRMKVLCIVSGAHMPSDYKQLDLRRILEIRRAMVATR